MQTLIIRWYRVHVTTFRCFRLASVFFLNISFYIIYFKKAI